MLNKLRQILLNGEVIFRDEKGNITATGVELEEEVILAIELQSKKIFIHYLDTNEEFYITNLISDIENLLAEEEFNEK